MTRASVYFVLIHVKMKGRETRERNVDAHDTHDTHDTHDNHEKVIELRRPGHRTGRRHPGNRDAGADQRGNAKIPNQSETDAADSANKAKPSLPRPRPGRRRARMGLIVQRDDDNEDER
jgi:hypothetical protein